MLYPDASNYIHPKAFNPDADMHRKPLLKNGNNLLRRKQTSQNFPTLLPAGARRMKEKNIQAFAASQHDRSKVFVSDLFLIIRMRKADARRVQFRHRIVA
jgi:hypothetical protein